MVIKIKDYSNFSRNNGEELRNYIILLKDKFIELDFYDIGYITRAFLDESIGKLFYHISIKEFKKRIKISHADQRIKVLIEFVIRTRLNMIQNKKSFIEKCIDGEANIDDIDFYIDEWYSGKSDNELSEFLGLTELEFADFIINGNAALIEIINKKRGKK